MTSEKKLKTEKNNADTPDHFHPGAERSLLQCLLPNRGWKKNLLTVAASVFLCCLIGFLSSASSNVRVLSGFDLANSIMPFFTFIFGLWWVLGYLIYFFSIVLFSIFPLIREDGTYFALMLTADILPTVVYSILPAVLWYAIRLKGEKKAVFPRLDTSAHVIKFYLIMLVSVFGYVLIEALALRNFQDFDNTFLTYLYWVMQYLDVVLIVGIPFLIIVSLVRNRTLTINERMVLAFLVIGVIAASMGAFFVYQNTMHLDPSLFEDYEALIKSSLDITDDQLPILNRYLDYWNQYYVMTAIMLNGLLIIEMAFMYSIEKKVTRPVLHLAKVLEAYAQPETAGPDDNRDAEKEGNAFSSTDKTAVSTGLTTPPEAGRLNPDAVRESCRPYKYGYGEISSLTRTCMDMVGRIDSYTTNLRRVTAEKERIGAELDVASKIQRDMLPGVFPPFPDRFEFDLYASMTPAKEVGGDFYDFYFIDNDHLALTIADVSGKGVPASLFMVISKTLLKNQAHTGSSPKQTLTYVNHQLCQNNESLMFCTVWLGILDLSTGKLTASNGGHEYPAVRKMNGKYELIKTVHDPALGVIDGIRYREYEVMLEQGDSLFVYTDGVPEATDASQELLGEERMINTLNIDPDASPELIIHQMHETIRTFVKGEPQFDDITMLCLKYLGSGKEHKKTGEELMVPARIDSLDKVTDFITQCFSKAGCPDDTFFDISLSVEEIFVNIAEYAYEGKDGDVQIRFSFDNETRMAEIIFTDSGLPFDPTARPDPDITLAPDQRQIGGLGIHIVKQTMDEVTYEYAGGKNNLTIRKRIPG